MSFFQEKFESVVYLIKLHRHFCENLQEILSKLKPFTLL